MDSQKVVYLSQPNMKLSKSNATIYSFGLPAKATCPNADACIKGCYCGRGGYIYKQAREKRERNYCLSLSDEFVRVMSAEIQYLDCIYKNLMIRIHDSGDFYSAEYMDKWIAIAEANPTIKFYGYTKMIIWYHAREMMGLPANFALIQSYGGKEDAFIDKDMAHAIVIKDKESLPDGYTIGNDDDLSYLSTNKIAFVYHGGVKWENSGFNKGE